MEDSPSRRPHTFILEGFQGGAYGVLFGQIPGSPKNYANSTKSTNSTGRGGYPGPSEVFVQSEIQQ